MRKKFLLLLVSLLMFTSSAFAYSNPRWFTMPVSVYLPKQAESVIVTNAFKSWQTGSKCVRFLYKNSANMAAISNINVIFKEQLPKGQLYQVNHRFPQYGNCRTCVRDRFFYHTDIIIALKDEKGKPLTQKQLNATAMQAVGVAIGVPLNQNEKSIMYKDSEFKSSSLTKDDINAVLRVYKPTHK